MFGKQSNEFLNRVDGNFSIASVCLSYLSFECFGSTEDIRSSILSGDYVLFTYAADEWLEHIRQCARHLGPEPLQSLRDTLSTFAEFRENYFFQAGVKGHHAAKNEFTPQAAPARNCGLSMVVDYSNVTDFAVNTIASASTPARTATPTLGSTTGLSSVRRQIASSLILDLYPKKTSRGIGQRPTNTTSRT